MKLVAVTIKNFRAYRDETRIELNGFTAFVGRNDVGKSSILEALEIFFNNAVVKIERADLPSGSTDPVALVGCEFTEFPEPIVIDKKTPTSLKEEHLLNARGHLEIRKHFQLGKAKLETSVVAHCEHPTADDAADLLLLKQDELRARFKSLGIDDSNVDLRSNPPMRRAIWGAVGDPKLATKDIPLDDADAKAIWEKLEECLPVYALFRADRPSRDEDDEVQDPMKVAIARAMKGVQAEFDVIKEKVRAEAIAVAERTLAKLREMDPELSRELHPTFRTDPKLDTVFKMSLTGEGQIPINKRGSGVRRLILLNFFRATAEDEAESSGAPGVIYAIEEPEASQHPNNQRMLAKTLLELAGRENCQVIVTTHAPGFVNLLPTESLRYVVREPGATSNEIRAGENVLREIADSLGVLPDDRVRVLVFVEGRHDVSLLSHFSRLLNTHDTSLPLLRDNPRVAFMPVGGNNLKDWVNKQYLKELQRKEVHIYDKDGDYSKQQAAIGAQGHVCFLTGKRESENYIHPKAIERALGIAVQFGNEDDVPLLVAKALHEKNGDPGKGVWKEDDEDWVRSKCSRAKERLNDESVSAMTYEEWVEIDQGREIEQWLKAIGERIV